MVSAFREFLDRVFKALCGHRGVRQMFELVRRSEPVGRKYRSGVDPEGLALTSRRRGALAGMMAAGAQVLRLLVLAIGAIFRPKALLIAENLCLRQQLVVLQRRHPRPRLSDADRRFWILASRWFSDWRHPLLIVKPETVLGWQRAGWRAYWRWRSSRQARGGRPAIRGELQSLIRRMAAENRLRGQRRIQAELARLGFRFPPEPWPNICECVATGAQPGRGESS